MGTLDGKVAVVTGAGRGIGQGIAMHLAEEGARVVVNDPGGSVIGDETDISVAEQTVKEIKSAGGDAVANTESVASMKGGISIIQCALDNFGQIDILANNAGILRDNPVHRMSCDEWKAVIDVHLNGSFYCTRAALPYMKDQRWGRVLFMTSTAGFIGTFAQVNYAAAKTGMLSFSRHIALEMNRYNITSNCVAPFAWTRIPASISAPTEEAQKAVDRLFKKMTPQDVSPLAVYLAGEEAKDITGQIFGVRGKEIYIFNQPQVVRSIHNAKGWTAEGLEQVLESTFEHHLTPLDNSSTYFTWEALT